MLWTDGVGVPGGVTVGDQVEQFAHVADLAVTVVVAEKVGHAAIVTVSSIPGG
jgi:hypothetical protein